MVCAGPGGGGGLLASGSVTHCDGEKVTVAELPGLTRKVPSVIAACARVTVTRLDCAAPGTPAAIQRACAIFSIV